MRLLRLYKKIFLLQIRKIKDYVNFVYKLVTTAFNFPQTSLEAIVIPQICCAIQM